MTMPLTHGAVCRYGKHFGQVLLLFDLAAMPAAHAADISLCSKFEAEGEVSDVVLVTRRTM